MTYKVTFEGNQPINAVEAKPGVIIKKYELSAEGDTIFDWIFVDADGEKEALEKARRVSNETNKKISN